jgi:hypothetical protein
MRFAGDILARWKLINIRVPPRNGSLFFMAYMDEPSGEPSGFRAPYFHTNPGCRECQKMV